MEIAKAIVLAGRPDHDRPWPSVRPGPKHLVPVANQPIIFHTLEALRRAGVLEAIVIVEPDALHATAAAIGDGSSWGLSVRCALSAPDHSGLAGALVAARSFVGDEPVIVQRADSLHRDRIHPYIVRFARDRLDALALRVANAPRDSRGAPLAGGYLFSERALVSLLERPEEIADPLADVMRAGGEVREETIDGCLACHGDQDQLLEGNRRVLQLVHNNVDPADFPTCEFQGPVHAHPTVRLEHTLVRGPVTLGPGTVLSHAYVGPYTSVGTNVVIEGAEIEHSIVFDDARLLHVNARLDSSIVGRGARVQRRFEPATTMRLFVGPGAEITIT